MNNYKYQKKDKRQGKMIFIALIIILVIILCKVNFRVEIGKEKINYSFEKETKSSHISGSDMKTMTENILLTSGTWNTISSMSGNIDVRDIKTNKIKSMSGDIKVYDSNVDIINTMSGDIDVSDSSIQRIKTMSGNIQAKNIKADTISTMSGNITIDKVKVKRMVVSIDGLRVRDDSEISHLILLADTDGKNIKDSTGESYNLSINAHKKLVFIVPKNLSVEKIEFVSAERGLVNNPLNKNIEIINASISD